MGLYHQQAQNFALAEDMFEMCADHAATPALLSECRYLLADAYATDGRLDEAARHVDEVLAVPETAPDVRGRALLLKGDIYEQQERRDEAARALPKPCLCIPIPPLCKVVSTISKPSPSP